MLYTPIQRILIVITFKIYLNNCRWNGLYQKFTVYNVQLTNKIKLIKGEDIYNNLGIIKETKKYKNMNYNQRWDKYAIVANFEHICAYFSILQK